MIRRRHLARRPSVRRLLALGAAVALVASACQAASPPASSIPSSGASSTPSSSAPAAPASQAAPSASPQAPTPTPVPTWTKPVVAKGLKGCGSIVGTVDDRGAAHLAAVCGNQQDVITYATSPDWKTWTATSFEAPAKRYDDSPQLAFSGDTLYLAWSRIAIEDGGCGDDGVVDVGVWYRTRTLPSGQWSDPVQLGEPGDELDNIRVVGSTIHATVRAKNGTAFYQTVAAGSTKRVAIDGAAGAVALRIGDDGLPRIAYESEHGIDFGTIDGDKVAATTIPKSAGGWNPTLALAPGNDAYLLWNVSYHGGGCAEPGPFPEDGTYFGTNPGGSWSSTRLSKDVSEISFTIDRSSGEVHAILGAPGVVYYNRAPSGTWTHKTLEKDGYGAVIRQDATTGALFVAFVQSSLDAEENQVEVMARR